MRVSKIATLVIIFGLILFAFTDISAAQTIQVDTVDELIQAIDRVNTGTASSIRLRGNITVSSAYQNSDTATPTITRSVTINGNDFTLSRDPDGDKMRFFEVADVAQFTIKNITLAGGEVQDNGGAIYVENSPVEVDNVDFNENKSTLDGGALYNDSPDDSVVIRASMFDQNIADGNGGGVHNTSATLTIHETTFNMNTADSGGGLFTASTMSLTNSNVNQNDAATNRGGGIYVVGDLSLLNTPITSNTANIRGGGIWQQGGQDPVRIENSPITGNRTDSTFTDDREGGGAFLNQTQGLILTDSEVSNNEATRDGGGIYHRIAGSTADVVITNSPFRNNSAGGTGGGLNNGSDQLTITGSDFEGNTASAAGGIYALGTTTLRDLTIEENKASGGVGGGIYANGSLNVFGVAFTNNMANTRGGGIYQINATEKTRIENSSLTGNQATSVFSQNRDGGGAFIFNTAGLDLINTTVTNNSALVNGGGLYIDTNGAIGDVTINNSPFRDNIAGNEGGGLYSNAAGNELRVSSSPFENNTAGGYGGAMALRSKTILQDMPITNNIATSFDGGGIFHNNAALLLLNRVGVAGNDAGRNGGGVYVNGELYMINSTVSFNDAGNQGGGLYTDNNTTEKRVLFSTLDGNTLDEVTSEDVFHVRGAPILFANIVTTCSSDLTSRGYNISTTDTCGLDGNNDLENQLNQLAGLSNNGGASPTQDLLNGALALDRVPLDLCEWDNDQNSVTEDVPLLEDQRRADRQTNESGLCDVGAVESASVPGAPDLRIANFDVEDSANGNFVGLSYSILYRGGFPATPGTQYTVQTYYSTDDTCSTTEDTLLTETIFTVRQSGQEQPVRTYIDDEDLPLEQLRRGVEQPDGSLSVVGYICLFVDTDNDVAETGTGGEDNNQAVDDFFYLVWDVNGDGLITPQDAIDVTNRIGTSAQLTQNASEAAAAEAALAPE